MPAVLVTGPKQLYMPMAAVNKQTIKQNK